MSAITAVYDPVSPPETGIRLFYNTSTAQLAVVLKNSRSTDDPDGQNFAASSDDYAGYIINPSHMASGAFRGFEVVVTVTVPKSDGKPTSNQISINSPIYYKIATTALQNAKVGVSTAEKEAWIYYFSGTSDATALKEYHYPGGNTGTYLGDEEILTNSSIGCWSDGTMRYVVYQDVKGHLRELDVINDQILDTKAESPMKNTSIATSIYKGVVYLYYTDDNFSVRRMTKKNGKWSNFGILPNTPLYGDGQMAVTTANQLNHLFYQAKGSGSSDAPVFTHIVDPVDE